MPCLQDLDRCGYCGYARAALSLVCALRVISCCMPKLTPLVLIYLCLWGFLMPFLWAFLLWLLAVWFLDLAIFALLKVQSHQLACAEGRKHM